MSDLERTVVLDAIEDGRAGSILSTQGNTRVQDLADAVPRFKQMHFDTFKAEYNAEGRDIVIHFFLPGRKVTELYWKSLFAQALNDVGQAHFDATAPRLVAKYTEELHSWWFKAQGYNHIIDIDQFIENFFAKLDARMGPALQTQSKTS